MAKNTFAQENKPLIEVGQSKININEPFLLSVTIKGQEDRAICSFPELNGFKKRTNSFTRIPSGNGFDQKFIQEYFANKTGSFSINNAKISVDGQTFMVPNASIIVVPSDETVQENFKDFIDGSAYEFVDVKDDAFFAITTNNKRPYIGEGFLVTIAFFIAQNNKAEMNFINENSQLEAILKSIRPKNCWEENLGISEIKSNKTIKIGKKNYFQYKIYQAIFYPLNVQPIQIQAQKWEMLKYKIAKDQEVSKEKKEDFKAYFSKNITIRPLPLPKNSGVPTEFVGDFEFHENLEKQKVQTGKSFNYTVSIKGQGNLNSIRFKEMLSDSLLEIYEPNIFTKKINNLGKLIDEKTFSFEIVPKFAGKYNLKDYFSINYFNVRTKTYEILQAKQVIEAVGRDFSNETSLISSENDVYENLNNLKSDENPLEIREIALSLSNILIITMLLAMIYIFWPAKK